jgi:hypothetical protein
MAIPGGKVARKIRKPCDKLTADDLEAFPLWEFALDEEHLAGQVETTVRPLREIMRGRVPEGALALAIFTFPNGRVRLGCATLRSGGDVTDFQPVLFADRNNILFYLGALAPSSKETAQIGKALKKISDPIFPIYFQTSLRNRHGDALCSGRLDGLYRYDGYDKPPRKVPVR